MIRLTEIPMTHDPVRFSGSVTNNETVADVIEWISKNGNGRHGIIIVGYLNNSTAPEFSTPYIHNKISVSVPDDIGKLHVYGFVASRFDRSGPAETIDYVIDAIDPDSTEYSGLRDDDWEE